MQLPLGLPPHLWELRSDAPAGRRLAAHLQGIPGVALSLAVAAVPRPTSTRPPPFPIHAGAFIAP